MSKFATVDQLFASARGKLSQTLAEFDKMQFGRWLPEAPASGPHADEPEAGHPRLRSEVNSELNFSPNFEGLVLGCIDADFCK